MKKLAGITLGLTLFTYGVIAVAETRLVMNEVPPKPCAGLSMEECVSNGKSSQNYYGVCRWHVSGTKASDPNSKVEPYCENR